MAVLWLTRFTFVDERGNKTSKTFKQESAGVDLALEHTAALNNADDLLAAFQAVSGAGVGYTLAMYDESRMGEAAAADSDVSDRAVVNTYLSPPPDEKLYALDIPAPIDALFVGGAAGTDVDITNAALIALVAEISADWVVSDGEAIDTSVTNGIKDGEWRSRAYNPR